MNGPYVSAFGNLTRDPDKRFSQNNGTEYARISIACNTVTGPDRRETEYFSINLYGNQMQNALARASKGTPVFVCGRFSHRHYQRQDGSYDCDLHIEARDFRILHRAPEGYRDDESQSPADAPQTTAETDDPDLDFNNPQPATQQPDEDRQQVAASDDLPL